METTEPRYNVNILTENTGEYKRMCLDEIIQLLEKQDVKELKIIV